MNSTTATVLTWNWKEQVSMDALNAAMDRCVHPHAFVIEPAEDMYSIVVAEKEMTLEAAQDIYDNWYAERELGGDPETEQ